MYKYLYTVHVLCALAIGGLTYIMVRSPQLQYPLLPVSLLSQQLVDLIVQVTDTKLTKTSCNGKEKNIITIMNHHAQVPFPFPMLLAQ